MIEVNDLVKRHGAIEILRGVSLSVERGEVAAIIGPSGSGKSTFLRCLNGLERFQSGRVAIDGLHFAADGITTQAELASNPSPGLPSRGDGLPELQPVPASDGAPERDGRPDLRPGTRPRAGPRNARDDSWTGSAWRIGCTPCPRQLSGGQQQRVAIARALAMEPQAILFDEPTSALDPRMTAEVLAVMSDLAGDGLTMIVVTHAMHFARRVAHTVHVFGDGRVIESGPPDQIFEDPREEATRVLLSTVVAA